MASTANRMFHSSVLRKQMVAIAGMLLVGFIIVHMAGNMLLLLGQEVFNGYAATLHAIPELLWVARVFMVAALVVHVWFTVVLYFENRSARGQQRYQVTANHGGTNFVRKTMIFSGLLIFFFVVVHLNDYTIQVTKWGADGLVGGGQAYGVYGMVWSSFLDPVRAAIYIAAVICVGAHLTHSIQSMFQTVGFAHERYTPLINKISVVLGVIVALGFSSIPIFVNIVRNPPA